MSDIIHLLPDSVANQIAAGEVIQRPASVIKELVENAIDAEATHIEVHVIDAGRTLIQVIDNGKGMSSTDARLAFERHATSKITHADDLFALTTMGFRGEALASIAAVAQVELRSRRSNDEIGTSITISGSTVERQVAIATAKGSNFIIRNLFYNVPARRKFLKSNSTEFSNIMQELERIALVYPEISFEITHDNEIQLQLTEGNIKQRIAQLYKRNIPSQLLPIEIDSSIVTLNGYIGSPESAKKRGASQFFFVNGRYMRHPYFHKAVVQCYEKLIAQGESPNYFIYLTTDPSTIDVNIHPTKTEIKFEHEHEIWQILSAVVRESLGKSSSIPAIEFDVEGLIDIPIYDGSKPNELPKVSINPNYNPFDATSHYPSTRAKSDNWEKLYDGFYQASPESPKADVTYSDLFPSKSNIEGSISMDIPEINTENLTQIFNKYILFTTPNEVLIIDQSRAFFLIQFENFTKQISKRQGLSQKLLFPELIELNGAEAPIFEEMIDELSYIGFDLANLGGNTFSINGIPSDLTGVDPIAVLHNLVHHTMEGNVDTQEEISRMIALTLSQTTAQRYIKPLNKEEMAHLLKDLFALPSQRFTPDGKKILSSLSPIELEKRF